MPTLHEFRPLSPIGPIQASILDGFGDVFGFEIGDVIQVSDCACDFQNAVVGAGAQALLCHGAFDEALAVGG